MASAEEIRELIGRGWGMPDGSAQIAAAEAAIRHADALGDRELAFAARMLATSAYHRGGEPAKSFVTFSWCLADYDEDPGRHDLGDDRLLRWFFKYVVSSLPRFPEIPLERTSAVLDDMQRRYLAGGHSLHAVHHLRWLLARHTGETDAADDWYARWCAAPRDENSDCAGCDPTEKVVHLCDRGRYAEAVALAEPVLAGHLTCVEQPHSMLTELLMPYLHTGAWEQARDAHRRAYRARRSNVANMVDVSSHIAFCALTGNEARGLEIVQRHLEWLERPPSPYAAMEFAAAAALTLRRLAATGHGGLPVYRSGRAEAKVADLAEELAVQAVELAARFDARNGGTYQSTRIAERLDAEPVVDYLPLSPSARHRVPVAYGVGLVTPAPDAGPGVGDAPATPAGGVADHTDTSAPEDPASAGTAATDAVGAGTAGTAGTGATDAVGAGIAATDAVGAETTAAAVAGVGDPSARAATPAGTPGTAAAAGVGDPSARAATPGEAATLAAARTGNGLEVEVPPDASAEELLDLAEHYGRTDRRAATRTVLRAFDERFGDAELEPLLAARRSDAFGNDLAERRDVDGAERAWRRAVDGYRKAGDELRAHVAMGRLGVLLCLAERVDEGLPLVITGRDYVLEHGSAERRAGASSRYGIALMAAGRSTEALAEFDRAAAEAEESGDPYLAADVALRRAHCLAGMDRPEEFRQAAELARDTYRVLGGDGLAVACLLYGSSFNIREEGEGERALDAFEEAVRAASPGRASVEPRLARARALCALDRAEESIDDFVEVVALCTELDLPDGAAFTRFELAGAYRQAGRSLEAAEVGEEAVTALVALEEIQAADRCRYLLAWTYRDLDEDDAALALLDELATNLDGYDNLPARGQMLEEAGDLLYLLDRDDEAAERFQTAAQAFAAAGLALDDLRARRRHALAKRWAGDLDGALVALAAADAAAAALPDDVVGEPQATWERAMLRCDATKILIAAGRLEDALPRITGTGDELRGIDAFGEALLADLLHGELLLRMERPVQAEPILRSVLTGLPRDADPLPQAAWLLAQSLAMQGRHDEARAVRAEHGIDDDGDNTGDETA